MEWYLLSISPSSCDMRFDLMSAAAAAPCRNGCVDSLDSNFVTRKDTAVPEFSQNSNHAKSPSSYHQLVGTLQSKGNDGQWHSYYVPMMRTNLLRGALKRHALGASARLGSSSGGGSDISALRCRARGRNLSSVVAVRDDGDDDGAAAATAAAMAQVRTAVNGAVKNRGLPTIPALPNKQRQNQEEKKSQPSAEDPVKKNYLNQIHTDDEEHVSPTHLMYTGGQSMPLTSTFKIIEPGEDAPRGIWPVFRMLVSRP